MKTLHIFWGALLIFFGLFFLARNLGLAYIDLDFILDFWPLLFIIWGLSMLKTPHIIKQVLSGLSAALLALLLIAFLTSVTHWGCDVDRRRHGIKLYSDTSTEKRELSLPFDSAYKRGEFKFSAGAGTFNISDTTGELVSVNSSANTKNIKLKAKNGDSAVFVRYAFDSKKYFFKNWVSDREAQIRLNPSIPWTINIGIGAAELNCDLTKYKVEKLDIDAGASDISVKMGELQNNSEIEIECGASNIELEIPNTIGCKIKAETGLSSNDFFGFNEENDSGIFLTENYNQAAKKMFIKISGGVSNFEVRRY